MRNTILASASLLLIMTAACPAAPEDSPAHPTQPGEPVSGSTATGERKPSVQVTPSGPKTVPQSDKARYDRSTNTAWLISLAALAGGTTMDAATSWGKREGNSLLASPNGTFGARGLSIKCGLLAAVVVPQLIYRRHGTIKKKFIASNFIEAGFFTGLAIHNIGVTAPR